MQIEAGQIEDPSRCPRADKGTKRKRDEDNPQHCKKRKSAEIINSDDEQPAEEGQGEANHRSLLEPTNVPTTSDADPAAHEAAPAPTNVPGSNAGNSTGHQSSLEPINVPTSGGDDPAGDEPSLAPTNIPALDTGNSTGCEPSLKQDEPTNVPTSDMDDPAGCESSLAPTNAPVSDAENSIGRESSLTSTNTATLGPVADNPGVACAADSTASPNTTEPTDSNDGSAQTLLPSREGSPRSDLLTRLEDMVLSFDGAALSMF
jgi:hypothetical protein